MKTTIAEEVYDFLNDAYETVNLICDKLEEWEKKDELEIAMTLHKFGEENFRSYQDMLIEELEENCKICINENYCNFEMVFAYLLNYYGNFFSLSRKISKPSSQLGEMGCFVWKLRSRLKFLASDSITRVEANLYRINPEIATDNALYPQNFLKFEIELAEGERIEDIDEQNEYYRELYSRYSNIEGYTDKIKRVEKKLMEYSKNEVSRGLSEIYLSSNVAKIDVIRVFIALYELGWFVQENGQRITQKTLFDELGVAFNRDELANYTHDLSQLKSNAITEKANVKIFNDMSKAFLEKCCRGKKS